MDTLAFPPLPPTPPTIDPKAQDAGRAGPGTLPFALGERPYGPPYRPAPPWPPAGSAPKPPTPAPFRPRELAAALAMVAACDVALFASNDLATGGLGLGLSFALVPGAMFVAARARRLSARLGVVVVMLAAVALRSVYHPTALATLAGLALIAAFAFALRARRSFVPEAIASTLYAVGKLPSRLGAAYTGARALASRTRLGTLSVLPVVIPIALVAVFAGVFALANPVVARGVAVAWDVVARVGLPSPLRVAAWGVFLVLSIAMLRPALRLAKGSESAPDAGESTKTSLLVARNGLAGLNVLFLAYNALDAAYLWSGRPPAGMRTQQYAHEGAFWLTVALAMLTAVVGVMFRGALAHDPRGKLARALAYAWMGQGFVLAIGTYRRIGIHVAHSGLSDLRIVGVLGTTLVACGVALVLHKLRARRTFAWLVRRQLDAFVVAIVLYGVAPTHLVAARVNVARITSGEYRPLVHTFRQSKQAESTATLLPLLHHDDVRVREGVAALLLDERESLRRDADGQRSWRERDLATRAALRALDDASAEIHAALGAVDRGMARKSLLEISRVANEDRSLDELWAVPDATARENESRYRGSY